MTFTGLTDGVQFDGLGYNIHAVYGIILVEPKHRKTSSQVRPVYVGNWTEVNGLYVPTGVIFKNHFRDFENQTLRIAMIVVRNHHLYRSHLQVVIIDMIHLIIYHTFFSIL